MNIFNWWLSSRSRFVGVVSLLWGLPMTIVFAADNWGDGARVLLLLIIMCSLGAIGGLIAWALLRSVFPR
jgi:hypothetical protein